MNEAVGKPQPEEQAVLESLQIRIAEPSELSRCHQLLDQHHYLGSPKPVGERLYYVVTDAHASLSPPPAALRSAQGCDTPQPRMMPKRGHGGRPEKRRSAAQQQWTASVGCASQAWEHLTDEQRLTWNVAASTRRTTGQRYFVQINAPRIRDGEALLTTPPPPESPGARLVLKELIITNRGSRISLKLRLAGVPVGRYTVWGARPCNRGLSGAPKCPRLGPLPAPVNQLYNITSLYFLKHGPYIDEHRLPLPGKRIYIRLRQEFDAGPGIYQEVRAIVPGPEDRGARRKKP